MTEITKESTGMNPKIKERIEQIQQGIVPEGYKKTRVGIIPEEWEVKKFKDIASKSKDRINPYEEKENYTCIELEHIESETGRLIGYSSSKLSKSSKTIFDKDNTLYGKLRPYLKKYYYTQFSGVCSTEIWVLKPLSKSIDSKFLFYLVQTDYFDYKANTSIGSSMPRADWSYVSNVDHAVPTLKEQQQIANVLSTWDRAIELKEALIKEKEDQKKGKLEYFFSKDFNESYTEEKFDNVFYRIPNGKYRINKKDYLEKGEFPVVDQSKSYIAGYTNQKEKLFEINNNPVIIFGDHTRVFKFVDFDFVVGADGTNILSTKKEYDIKYFYYAISSKRIPDTGYNRHYKFLQEMTFYVPPIKLQKKVSKILSYLDYNINLLKQELSLLKEQKKGLMQLLLTGIVRVGEVKELE